MKRLALWMTSALLVVATTAMAGPGAHGPNGEHLDNEAGNPASGLTRLPDGSVNVPKPSQRRMGLRTVIAPLGKAAGSVELSGRVVMDPNAGGRVQAAHGGTVEPGPQGLPIAGLAVRKGQVLAYLRHHAEPFAQANQQSQLAELKASREVAEQRLRRLESLEGTTPRKEIEAARAELSGLQARERTIGGSLSAREAVVAPVSGVIARADVVAGQVVDSRETMFEVIDPTRLLVEAVVADPALAASLGAAELKSAPGYRLAPLGAARALRDGVLPVTFRATAASGAAPLALGQPVTVIARLKTETEGIVLPAAAVVRNPSNEPVVWIKVTAERFLPQPVQLQALDANTVLVTKGLAPDNRVVVQGAALVNQIR
jgi:cobalt-zinc-cadmium efflux system membrane fusion protein